VQAGLIEVVLQHGGAQLQSGMSSLLFVTAPRGREAQAVQELYSMLPEYVEVAATMAKDTDTRATSGEGKDGDDEADEEADEDEAAEEEAEEEEDLEAMMQKELNELRDPQKYKKNEAIVRAGSKGPVSHHHHLFVFVFVLCVWHCRFPFQSMSSAWSCSSCRHARTPWTWCCAS